MSPAITSTNIHSAGHHEPTQTLQPLLVRACQGEFLERPPVWLMRQAGRYMAEYQAIRSKVSFLELCKNPELATEVSLQPLQAFGMDAVILFSDILIPPEAMGMTVEFTEHKGPVFQNPLRTAAAIEALRIPDPLEKTGFVMDILKSLRRELISSPEVALIGFAGAPWTLASYMVEGSGSRNFTYLKQLMYNQPALLHQLLDKLAQTVTLYLQAQIEAGAQVVQLFDTWACILDATHYRRFVLPYVQQIIAQLPTQRVPVVLYVNGSAHLLEVMAETGATVISVDWLTPLEDAHQRIGNSIALQGNLDPNTLFSTPEVLKPLVEEMIQAGGPQGYIANLGHGILPQTPVENVRLFVDTVKNHRF